MSSSQAQGAQALTPTPFPQGEGLNSTVLGFTRRILELPSTGQVAGAALLALGLWLTVGPVQADPPKPEAASQEAAQPQFDLLEIRVDGNSVLETGEIEKTVYPFLGPGKTIDTVEEARQALEAKYRERGYQSVIVEIPEQDVVEGGVFLKVVEGTIERLKVTGSRYYSLGKIREGVPALAEGQVPNMAKVQEQVGELAKQSGDRSITPVFRAGTTPGKMEVELKVKDELPLHGSVEMNGRNTENTTRSRLSASLRYDNLWQRFHSASLSYQVSPENFDEVEVWSGTYVMPTGIADTRLAMYGIGIASNTQLGASVGGLSVIGTGYIFGARLVKPLGSVDNFYHSLSFGFDYKDFNQGLSLVGQDTQQTPITYVPFQIGYDASLRGDGWVTTASTAAHFSIRGLGNDQNEFDDGEGGGKRFGSRSNFFFFTGDLKHQQQLPYDAQMTLRAGGQVTDSPLISNEQFAVGGPGTVRGYHQTQQLGDHGVNLSMELASPHLLPAEWEAAQNLRALVFFDWAYLWIKSALPGQASHYQLAAPGAGLRLRMLKHLVGELDWAYPLYRQGTVDPGNQRVDFRLAYEF